MALNSAGPTQRLLGQRGWVAMLGVVSILTIVVSACSTGEPPDASNGSKSGAPRPTADTTMVSTTMLGMGPDGAPAPGDCPSRMPGEPLNADEAVVKFNVERICPGYVTIELGTPVTWANDGDTPADITVTEYQAPQPGVSLPVVIEHTVAPGESWEWTPDTAGMLGFRISTVDAFVGTIEVQIQGEGSPHVH